jgi:quinol monooxygenase YgiN
VATLLAHICVREGMEVEFEEVVAELYRATHERESAVLRYEYFRGTERGAYYCLLSFDDYQGFLTHQSSAHHEAASPALRELTETIRLEWLDPIQAASPLPPTDSQMLPRDASVAMGRHHERFGDIGESWWMELR